MEINSVSKYDLAWIDAEVMKERIVAEERCREIQELYEKLNTLAEEWIKEGVCQLIFNFQKRESEWVVYPDKPGEDFYFFDDNFKYPLLKKEFIEKSLQESLFEAKDRIESKENAERKKKYQRNCRILIGCELAFIVACVLTFFITAVIGVITENGK